MNDEITIRPSRKMGLDSSQQYILTYGNYVCLRILGDGASYEVMSATADEDNKTFRAPPDQEKLIELAWKTAEALGITPVMCCDNYGRNYVKICRIDNEEDEKQLLEAFSSVIRKQEQVESKQEQAESEARKELREIYEAVAPDDSGEDAYLGDGMWIGSDGSFKDLGR